MKVKVLFFASLREELGTGQIEQQLTEQSTVNELCQLLAQDGPEWLTVFGNPSGNLKISVNQEMAQLDTTLNDGDEIAFFPPVTGG